MKELKKLLLGRTILGKAVPILLLFFCFAGSGRAAQLYVGAASVNITPPLPVAVSGQMYLRVAREAQTPVTANIIALETRGRGQLATVIMVSVDLVGVTKELQSMVLEKVKQAIPGIDTNKIIINAIHTHTAPVTTKSHILGLQKLPEGVTTVEQTVEFISDQIASGIQQAWKDRRPGSVTWGLGHAGVGINRRATYYDGSAQMYGKTDLPEFRGLAGPAPDEVNVLFFWDKAGMLRATYVNVPCPAQVVEHRKAVNADYWHPVRQQLRKRFGTQLVVAGTIGAAGDESPHPMYEGSAEKRMRQLQGIDRLHQLAVRIVEAVEDVYEVVKTDQHSDVQLRHEVKELQLPRRLVSRKAADEAKAVVEKIQSADEETRLKSQPKMLWEQAVIDRYKQQRQHLHPMLTTTIHVVRLGDVAIATNPFELFSEYGERIKARSRALQTFNIQLTGPYGGYLPTMHAVRGGDYSAIVESNKVGPEAGQILVDRTVELINGMWPEVE